VCCCPTGSFFLYHTGALPAFRPALFFSTALAPYLCPTGSVFSTTLVPYLLSYWFFFLYHTGVLPAVLPALFSLPHWRPGFVLPYFFVLSPFSPSCPVLLLLPHLLYLLSALPRLELKQLIRAKAAKQLWPLVSAFLPVLFANCMIFAETRPNFQPYSYLKNTIK